MYERFVFKTYYLVVLDSQLSGETETHICGELVCLLNTMNGMTPLFVGGIGGFEIAVIAAVFVLLFGANKIPELARSSGKAIGEFQKGREEVEQELDEIRGDDTENGGEVTEGAEIGEHQSTVTDDTNN